MSHVNLNEAILLGQLVQAAYKQFDGQLNPATDLQGYEIVEKLFGNDLATGKSRYPYYVPFGFLLRKGPELVIALRGTENIFEWIDDFTFEKLPTNIEHGAGRTEDGFSDVYASLRNQPIDAAKTIIQILNDHVQEGDSLVVAGHSLGAALATLCGYDASLNGPKVPVSVYTYASPNVGDLDFATSYNEKVPETWRISNAFDIVTHNPPNLFYGYHAVGTTVGINPLGKVKLDIGCMHALTTYLHLLGVLEPQATPLPLDRNCVPL
jgi:triacylglycerol lipase